MKRKILAFTLLAMMFTMASCNKENSSETNSTKTNEIEPSNSTNEVEAKETNESIFDKWEEIELSAGKIEAIKFYGYNRYGIEEFIALGKDNYVYGRVYDETNNKYYYSTSSGNKWKFIEDSIIAIHRGTKDYKFLVYEDMLIALDGTQEYYKKGEPKVIDYDNMVLELEINGKSVDVTWENNESVKKLKEQVQNGLTIYVNKGYHQIFKDLDFVLNNRGSLSEVKIGEIWVETSCLVLFYDTPIVPETGKNIKSSGELIGKINMNFEDLTSLINSNETVSLTFNLK